MDSWVLSISSHGTTKAQSRLSSALSGAAALTSLVMAGAAVPLRSGAVTTTMLFGFFYFLLINLARLLPLSLPMTILVEGILPIVLPLVISIGALRLAAYFMNRD